MVDGMNSTAEADLEQRSGLPGLGGRPRLHPAWGEARPSAPASSMPANGEWRPNQVLTTNLWPGSKQS